MVNYNNKSRWAGFKYSIIEFLNKNKWLLTLLSILIVLALLTGIFTSIKLYNLDNDIDLEKYSMYSLIDGNIYSFGFFLLRYLSCVIIIGLLFVFSKNVFLGILGIVIIVYRAFLVTLNCTFIIIKLGFGGILSSVLIIFPCQLLILLLLALIFITFVNMAKNKKECGMVGQDYLRLFFMLLLILFLVDIVEVTLLLIFKPTTILIV